LGHQLNGYGEHDGAVLLRGDGGEGLEVSQLESSRALRDDVARLLQGLARLLFSLSSDDLSSGLSGSLSLSSHGSLQTLRKPHILHLNSLDVNSPGVSSVVNLGLQVFGNDVSLRECFRQGLGSQDVPKGGGRKEFSGIGVVFNLTNSIHRVADVVVNNSVKCTVTESLVRIS